MKSGEIFYISSDSACFGMTSPQPIEYFGRDLTHPLFTHKFHNKTICTYLFGEFIDNNEIVWFIVDGVVVWRTQNLYDGLVTIQ